MKLYVMLLVRNERPTDVAFCGAKRPPLSVDARVEANKLVEAAQALLESRSDHLFDEWCIADIDLAIMLNRLILHGDPVPPRLVEYATRQWLRAAAQIWIAQPRPPR